MRRRAARAAFRAVADSDAGTAWLTDLMRAAPNQLQALHAVARARWMPDTLRDRVFARMSDFWEA